ncbi:YjgP/YjgQ family permease [Puteibacter caeruleilacunae]|nr:YjgP/YjgQ family permease [Puteibacter caeruleilacunae]
MKRLHIFTTKSFLGPFLMTFLISIFVLMMQGLWKYLDDIVGKGLEWTVITELFFYLTLTLVPMALPLAILLASIMTFGNMGEYYELTAMKSAGISLVRIMRPLALVVMTFTLSALLFSNYVLPYSYMKFAGLMLSIKSQNPEAALQEGVFMKDFDPYVLKVDRIDGDTKILHGVMIYDHTYGQGNKMVTIADSGRIEMTEDKLFLKITLFDGYSYKDEKQTRRKRYDTHPFRRDAFKEQVIIAGLKGFSRQEADDDRAKSSYKAMSLVELAGKRDTFEMKLQKDVRKFMTKLHFNTPTLKSFHNDVRPDSLKIAQADVMSDTIQTHDIDSLYAGLETQQRIQVLESALAEVKSNQREMLIKRNNFTERQRWINKHDIEKHRKFTWSVACLIFFFIGAPLGAIIRKGGLGMPVVVSVFLFIFYFIITMTGEKFAREGVWMIWQGCWLSTFIFAPLGVFLTYKAAHDSTLMSTDTYVELIKKLNIFKKKKQQKVDERTNLNQQGTLSS